MRLRIAPLLALGLFLLLICPVVVRAQAAEQNAIDVKTHLFEPKIPQGSQAATSSAGPTKAGISLHAVQQINSLVQEKRSRTPAQVKISSRLLYTSRMLKGQAAATGVGYLRTGVVLDEKDSLYVDITARVTDAVLERLKKDGVRVINYSVPGRSIRAFVPPAVLETIAAYPEVIFIMPKQDALTNQGATSSRLVTNPLRNQNVETRAARIRAYVSSVLATSSGTGVGSKSTEGDVTHRANDARNTFGIDGAGVKIGVLSDGVSHLYASQAYGDLPKDVTILTGQEGYGDEGTAMLEIIRDIAPGAKLYFASAMNGIASFGDNIRALRAAGCDIIVDDASYFVESAFQDGQTSDVVSNYNAGYVVQAVNEVVADGALYFSAAANAGNLDSGTSGTFEGDFVDAGASELIPGGSIHQFAPGVNYDTITVPSYYPVVLHWSDPLGASSNDYDLFILDPAGENVIASSTDIQDGSQDPIEGIGGDAAGEGNRIVVLQKTGANARFLHIATYRAELAVATDGETHGHSAASGAFTVAATPAIGPFPKAFTTADVIETFSSDGPRRIFYNADSTPIVADVSSTGGRLLQKPEITAADGVSVTGVAFVSPFYGTSAAAPHAAAIAALLKSAKPDLTYEGIRNALMSTAIDILSPGWDHNAGAGILDAFEAVRSLGVPGGANPDIDVITATENPGNRNGVLEAGEGGRLVIQLKNTTGLMDATGITATLTTSTPGVTIVQPGMSTYADLARLTGTGENVTPFLFTLASDTPCGLTINFNLELNYTGGPPRTFRFSVPTGVINISSTLDGAAPPPFPNVSTATGQQAGRLYRTGTASLCGPTKAFPGYGDLDGSRTFDSYSLTACRDACTDVTVRPESNFADVFTAAYSPEFSSGDTQLNYVGDAGISTITENFGLSTFAGNTYTFVVHEVTPGSANGTNYNLQISACAFNCATPNAVPVAKAKNVTVTTTPGTPVNASVDDGSSDADGDELTIVQTPPGPYSIGTTNVLLTVSDNKGATSQASGSVTVVVPDFTISSGNSSLTVTAGQSVTEHITIVPTPLLDSTITFSCSGLPERSTCAFTPTAVTPGSAPVNTELTITTTAPTVTARLSSMQFFAIFLPFGCLGLIVLGGCRRERISRLHTVVLAMLLGAALFAMVGCGGSDHHSSTVPGTPPGTYTITVTASSTAVTHSTTLTLTVR